MKRSAFFWDVTQRRMVILYRRFGQLISPIFKGQEVQERVLVDFLTLRNIAAERRSHQHRGGSLKSRMFGRSFACEVVSK
jgi:hypothetical protein